MGVKQLADGKLMLASKLSRLCPCLQPVPHCTNHPATKPRPPSSHLLRAIADLLLLLLLLPQASGALPCVL